MLNGEPPTVTDVYVGGTAWTPAFYEYLNPSEQPDFGYRIPMGTSDQTKSLPWTNINKIVIRFSEDVNVKIGDLSLSAINATGSTFNHFFYDAIERAATWTLANPLGKNSWRLDLDANGVDPVRDLEGNTLAGGDFEFSFRVMPGDVNQDSTVTTADHDAALARLGLDTSAANYSPLIDVDGNGHIQSADAQHIFAKLGATYQTGAPVGASDDAPTSTGVTSLVINNPTVNVVATNLFDTFSDDGTSDDALQYQIESASNSYLFDVMSINENNGNLVLSSAPGASGRSEIVVRATDKSGLSTTTTVLVDVSYVNQAPQLYWNAEAAGSNEFWITGYVTDDYDVEGLIVEFWGAFNLRATVRADGTFSFWVIVFEEDWGMAHAQVVDRHGLVSNIDDDWVGIT